MRRRRFIAVLGGALVGTPLATQAQQSAKIPRIGRLSPTSASIGADGREGFQQGMRDLGWVEGKNFTIENRFAEGNPSRLADLAAQLVRLNVDVIVAGSSQGALAAKKATSTIPIVMVMGGDPVTLGFVASLARPGGNLTGVTALAQELSAKRLELITEAVSGVDRVAVLSDPTYPDSGPTVKRVKEAARVIGVRLHVVEIRDPAELGKAFATMNGEHSGALMVLPDIILNQHRKRIVELAAKNRLPAVYPFREYVDAGGLLFYGASFRDMYRRAATYVDRILKGAKPSDLPVEQPTKFELVINLKTAKALGLTIPPSLLIRADQVIE